MNIQKAFLFFISALFIMQCKAPEKTNAEPFFYSFDKTKIAFTDDGKGEAVVLLHGFIVNGSSWDKSVLKNSLLDRGFRVIVPDLRGNGDSDKPQKAEAYQNNAEIKDIMKLADYLQLESYKTVGYSRGSIVLAKLLTMDKRISKAVLGGMGLDFTNPEWNRRKIFADAFTGRKEPNEMTSGAIEFAKSIDANIRALGYLQDFQPVTSIEELSQIKISTMVICGDSDKDNGDPEELQKNIPNSKLVIVEGDHNNTYKQENFAKAVIDFL